MRFSNSLNCASAWSADQPSGICREAPLPKVMVSMPTWRARVKAVSA
jgi:hypothetical protein